MQVGLLGIRDDAGAAERDEQKLGLVEADRTVGQPGKVVALAVACRLHIGDAMAGGDDVSNTRELLRGWRGAVGAVLNTDEGVRAALDARVEFIVVRHELPALLAACAANAERINA